MIISAEHKYIFIHIPKTAGTTLAHAMIRCGGVSTPFTLKDLNGESQDFITHSGAIQLQETIGSDQFADYFSFSFVRNPWDRLVSLYNFKIQSAKQRLSGKRPKKPSISDDDDRREISYMESLGFLDWVLEGDCDNHLYGESLTRLPQLCWLTDASGKIIVDYIARFENLQEEFRRLSQRVPMDFNGPVGNPSKHAPWWSYYNEEVFSCVAERFAADIDCFQYQTDWKDIVEQQDDEFGATTSKVSAGTL